MLNKSNDKWTILKITNRVKVLKNNEIYRLGDGIRFKKTHFVIKHILENPKYDNTILKLFHKDPSTKPNLYQIVEKQRNNRENFVPFEDDTLVVHIRLGDDINKRGLGNTKNMMFFVNQINKSKCARVIIVTALHYGISDDKDALYKSKNPKLMYQKNNHIANIEKLYQLISQVNKPVNIISNVDVDLDVLHLVFCRHLLTSNDSGSFSRMVQNLHNKFIDTTSRLIKNV